MEERRRFQRPVWLPPWWPLLAVALVALGYAAFVGLAWWILANAHAAGARAQREFGGDEVQALSRLVDSDRHSLAGRNHAVNALGILADSRALPVLEKYYTGEPCQHDRFLCQYELKKAIDRCQGRNRPPRWLPFLPGRD
jgi:hypothetical protein